MTLDDLPEYLKASDLAPYGFTTEDVRRLCQGAVEYVALDGSPCWRREYIAPLLGSVRDGSEP
jgi:hypothetical protein